MKNKNINRKTNLSKILLIGIGVILFLSSFNRTLYPYGSAVFFCIGIVSVYLGLKLELNDNKKINNK